MNKVIFFAFAVLFVCKSFATTIIDGVVKLPKHFKVENTFSGDLSDTKSFHLIISKNRKTKQYTVHSYLYDGENITEIQPFQNEKAYEVVSFHQKNNQLTLLLSYKKKRNLFLKPVSINLKTNYVTEGEAVSHEDFSTSFREKNRSVLVYKTDDKFIVKEFDGNQKPTESSYTFSGKKDELKKYLKNNSIIPIKTDEFVKNGATSELKGYLNGKKLTISKENEDDNETNVITLNFAEKNISPSKIKTFTNKNGEKDFKKSTSYINNNKLYQLGLNKKGGKVKISDIETQETNNTINLDASLASKIKGNKEFQGIEKFLKNAGKNKYNATITVNPTKNKKVRVRIDYVNRDYNYHYNWWWHHHQFMMWQHQQMMNNIRVNVPSGFGPRQPNDGAFESVTIKKEKRFFELVIDTNGLISDEELPEANFKEIDKKEYIDRLDDIRDIKKESSCFLKNDFRYFGYSKKQKGFVFKTDKIK